MQQFNKQQVAQSFGSAAERYDNAAVLQQTVGERLIERLDYIRLQPKRILDVGCGTGYLTRALSKHFKKAEVIGYDLAPGMIAYAEQQKPWFSKQKYICGDAEKLDFPDNHFDFIYSNLMLHWANDLQAVLKEFQRVLRPNGLLLFSSLGPDTLKELRISWMAADQQEHVHPFIDMHHVGDALLQVGLVDPVMDMEMITLTYPTVKAVMRDLKEIGAHNLANNRHKGLTGKSRLKQVEQRYESFRREDGTLPLSYEVVYGHAWGSELKEKPQAPREINIPIDQIIKPSS